MIKTNKFFLLLLFVATFTFISCENEPVDPEFSVEVPLTCTEPSLFTVSSFINGNTVRIDWDKASGDTWEVQYGTGGFALGTGTTVNFTVASSLISGLVEGTVYDFYIRTKCSDSEFSTWVGPVSPGSSASVCANPTNLTAVRSTTDATKVVVTWSVNGDENSWQVQYGNQGFVVGSGTILASLSPTKTILGLLENVGYDFYVRSNCDANQNSGWVGPITVTAVGAGSANTFTAKINGFDFVDIDINVNANALHNGVPSFNIIASNLAGDQIDINVDDDVVVGTAYFNTDPLTDKFRFIYFEPSPVEFQTDTNGSITIIERTATRIKGTFYFNAINPTQPLEIRNITEGSFDIAIP
jgi:hypothetical protein